MIMAIPIPRPIQIKDVLVIGRTYNVKGKFLRLVGLYDEYARFKDVNGLHECYRYWDLERILTHWG